MRFDFKISNFYLLNLFNRGRDFQDDRPSHICLLFKILIQNADCDDLMVNGLHLF